MYYGMNPNSGSCSPRFDFKDYGYCNRIPLVALLPNDSGTHDTPASTLASTLVPKTLPQDLEACIVLWKWKREDIETIHHQTQQPDRDCPTSTTQQRRHLTTRI